MYLYTTEFGIGKVFVGMKNPYLKFPVS
ncbi:uncharacterized protein METZ01_LOCUS208473 [marine metagenome]|uniref:Biopterin-dependent aromatic amino acid hydroxylase family profile domain-containing protein n=1 Tax=marine metagenome TaxID=408172 RepID=A0A382EYW5_9ZZZZ